MKEEVKARAGKLDELIPDDRNMNRHTPYGMSLIEKSLRQNGFGRSIFVDKDNRIIGGNGVVENAAQIGMEDTIVVETTGDKLVVVKRTDVSLDSKQGREMAMADNATALADVEWDTETIREMEQEHGISAEDWGVILAKEEADEAEQTTRENFKYETQFGVIVMCGSEEDQERIYNKLTGEGYSCKVVSV